MSTTPCFHCHEPVVQGSLFTVIIQGQPQAMCCPGCAAVAEAIIQAGLTNYYQYRTEPGSSQQGLVPEQLNQFSAYDLSEVQQDFVTQEQDLSRISLSLDGITCAACAWLIEHKVSSLAGIRRISVNSTTQRALIFYEPDSITISAILNEISRIGYQAAPFTLEVQELKSQRQGKQFLLRLGLAGFATMQVMMFALALYSGFFSDLELEFRNYFRWVSLIFSAPVVFYSAAPFYFSALRSLLSGRVNMDVSVSIAIGGAYIASVIATINGNGEVYFESVTMFTFFLLLGRYFEQKALQTASISASNLQKVIPLTARLVLVDGYRDIAAKQLAIGDVIQVLPGDSIAADGDIIKGQSSCNESMLTGEQTPMLKQVGDPVFAGSINLDQTLEVRVTALGADQLVSKIILLQEAASHTKPKIAELANRLSGIFSTIIILIATLTYIAWMWLDPSDAFWVTLSVLVATCPCALALATPTAVTCTTGQLTKMGIIVRRASVFEAMPRLTHVVFDKTGTLTCGNLSLRQCQLAPTSDEPSLLNLIANIEQGSLHPIANACRSYLRQKLDLHAVRQHVGKGLTADYQGHSYRVGHYSFACDQAQLPDWYIEPPANPLEQQVWLSCDQQPLACLVFTDELRQDAHTTVSQLFAKGIKVSIASGDHSEQVEALAHQLGIDTVHSALLPEDKLKLIHSLQAQGECVAMFGDGINDAPVLAAANLSVAMGSGSAIAKNSADMILLGDHLSRFVAALSLSKATSRIIYQNLYWALGYNLLIIPLAVTGQVYPYIAALGMSLSSLIVVSNSLRLLRMRP
ncbi:heavy metal translocating P-type ATPase [Shewanella sp. NIFS-20-20]|uniref:heavy metal translocating P-type ATPase n=1 Tax=Shewanella sp. NIFS-20-20 TaxID=2853806 RepID=UPI001C465B35|nr:heavy metal translocating P-type ATPase [Shewanella sp. NIFS-20-20]MBV7315695.1 heavy metal translocating P-type ATPase [Shewanella sp. NIFS-20-20]